MRIDSFSSLVPGERAGVPRRGPMFACLLAVTICLGAPAPASAQTLPVQIVVNPNPASALPGSSLLLSATLTNQFPFPNLTAHIMGSIVTVTGPTIDAITVDDSPFLLNSPASLAPLSSSGPFQAFELTVDPGAGAGAYACHVDLFGTFGGDPAETIMGETTFTLNVGSTVPEPTSLWLAAGAAGVALPLRRRRRSRRLGTAPGPVG